MKNSSQKNANRVLHLFTALCVVVSFCFWSCRPLRVAAQSLSDSEILYASSLVEKYGTKLIDASTTGGTNAAIHGLFELAHALNDIAQTPEYEYAFSQALGIGDYSGQVSGSTVYPIKMIVVIDGTPVYSFGEFHFTNGGQVSLGIRCYSHPEYNWTIFCTSASAYRGGVEDYDRYWRIYFNRPSSYLITLGSVYDTPQPFASILFSNGSYYPWNYYWKRGGIRTFTPTSFTSTYTDDNTGQYYTVNNILNHTDFYLGDTVSDIFTSTDSNIYEPQAYIDSVVSRLIAEQGEDVVSTYYDFDIDFNHIPPSMDGFTFPENLPAVDFHDVDVDSATIPQKLIESARFYFNTFDSLADDLGIKPVLIFFLCLALLFAILKI